MGFGDVSPRARAATSSARCMNRSSSVIELAGSRASPARSGASLRSSSSARPLRYEGLHEALGIERLQVLHLLADADQLDRHAELAHDPHHDPALRGAVELRETETGEPDGLMEHGGL